MAWHEIARETHKAPDFYTGYEQVDDDEFGSIRRPSTKTRNGLQVEKVFITWRHLPCRALAVTTGENPGKCLKCK